MFKNLGLFLGKHYRATLAVSVVAISLAAFYGLGLFGNLSRSDTDFVDKGSQSYHALTRSNTAFGDNTSDLTLLFSAEGGKTIDDPAVSEEIQRRLKALPAGLSVNSYYSTKAAAFVSQDRRQTFATVTIKTGDPDALITSLRTDTKNDQVAMYVGGREAISHDINRQVDADLSKAETISFAVLAVLLVLVFRSFVAAALPLILGGATIMGAFFVTNALTSFTDISTYAVNVIIMIGLGLSIDYSLFVVARFREELRGGHTVPDALTTTVATAGRTVFFSGLTVILSLLSLLVFPLDFLRSMGLGGSAAVLVAMTCALLVLPSILRLLGHKVNALSFGSIRRDHAASAGNGAKVAETPSIWYKSGRFFMRRPWASVAAVLGLLVLAGSQFLHAHFALPDYRSLPEGSEARLVSERLTKDFDIDASPLVLTFSTQGPLTTPENIGHLYNYTRGVAALDGVKSVDSITNLPQNLTRAQYQTLLSHPIADPALQRLMASSVKNNLAIIKISYDGAPEDATAQTLVSVLRDLPPPDGASVLVGGRPAELADLLASLEKYIPIGLAVIVVTLFILLFLMLGSVVTPIKAILMNILSLSTAYGAMVWVFQDGHLTAPLNLTHTGTLDATMPVLIFAVAFGLSMDYSVFLYSRIKESYDKTGDNETSVLEGLQKTGSIITSASILLFVVVAAFATARVPLMQQIGLGLALTVLVDAFLVRMVLVPALMKLINRYNWWAPAPMKRFQEKLGLSD